MWWRLGRYGDACVTVFFVLSGYVIAFASSSRELTLRDYTVSRLSRLYSVTLVGLTLTYFFDTLGKMIDPSLYEVPIILWKPESWSGYLSSLFFVNEFQGFNLGGVSPGSNAPFWSLSFEAAYYVGAGLLIYLPAILSIPLLALLLTVAGRTITALFPIWLVGYGIYRFGHKIKIKDKLVIPAFFISGILILLAPDIVARLPSDNFGLFCPWAIKPFNRNLIADYLVAAFICCHLLSAQRLFSSYDFFGEKFSRVVRWLGSLTFPLYCIHFPALCFFRAVSPWSSNSKLNMVFLLAAVFALVIPLTPICDKFKNILRARLRSSMSMVPS